MRRALISIAEGLVLAGLFAVALLFLTLTPELDAAVVSFLGR
jgi:hypothetical protein